MLKCDSTNVGLIHNWINEYIGSGESAHEGEIVSVTALELNMVLIIIKVVD